MACTLKAVNIDTGSYWIRKFKEKGYEGLKDGRTTNGRIQNSELDEYVLGKFNYHSSRGIPVNGEMIRQLALSAPASIKAPNFNAFRGWLTKLLRRLRIIRRKCTHRLQSFVDTLIPEIWNYLSILDQLRETDDSDMVFVNFEEVPFFLDPCGDYTCNEKGSKEVAIITHRQSKTRVSVMPTICSNGHCLPPLLYLYTSHLKAVIVPFQRSTSI